MTTIAVYANPMIPIAAPFEHLPLVAAVVVHWSNIADTVECLKSLSKVDDTRLNVIVVNNGSADFSEARVREAFPEVLIVISAKNLGFAAGNNLGITRALEEKADLILFLNNDAVVSPDIIRCLLPAIQEQTVGIAGPVITYYDTPEKIWYAGGIYSRLLGFNYSSHRCPLPHVQPHQSTDFVTGCAMLVKREVFEAVGMFSNVFFLYFEEVDFCLRAAKANYRCVLVWEPLVRHKVSASAGRRGTDHFTPDKAYYFGRNPFHLLRRHASGVWAVTGVLSQFAVIFPYWILRCLLARNTGVLPDYVVGMWDGIAGRTGKRPM